MSQATSLEDLLGPDRGHRHRCPACGEEVTASIVLSVRERKNGKLGRAKSASTSFCATHAAERFLSMREELTRS